MGRHGSMSIPESEEHAAVVVSDDDPAQAAWIDHLRSAGVTLRDDASLPAAIELLVPPLTAEQLAEPLAWAYFPWHATLVRVPGPEVYERVRLDRNRLKITSEEQARLRRQAIGIVGLSSGFSIALTLALDGLCGSLRLADFDAVELSNLNRLPQGLLELGVNKAVAAARRIAELDPYLSVDVLTDGVTAGNISEFVAGLDVVIDQCDAFDMKIRLRETARRHRIPVLMQTNDSGLLDIERFDLEPDRPLFHGLLPPLDPARLSGLTPEQRTAMLLQVVGGAELSARGGASLLELGRTVGHWPQLGSESQFGAAAVAMAVRRLGLDEPLPSRRLRIDLDRLLGDACAPAPAPTPAVPSESTTTPSTSVDVDLPTGPILEVVTAATRAPSGGNSQPWRFRVARSGISIDLAATAPTTSMDLRSRGSLVAVGAAAFNARVAASAHSMLGPCRVLPRGRDGAIVELSFLDGGAQDALTALYPAVRARMSNRNQGERRPLDPVVADALLAAGLVEGATVHLLTEPDTLDALGEVLGESDRIRYLTPRLHEEMTAELSRPGRDRLDIGIDVRTLGLGPAAPMLDLVVRPDVMARLAATDGGSVLRDITAQRVATASAVAVVTVDADTAADYVIGGSAVERVWVTAVDAGLGVYPISPVFLYVRSEQDLASLTDERAPQLAELQRAMQRIVGIDETQVPALLLRMCHNPGAAIRSLRRPLSEVMISSDNAGGVTTR